MGNKVYYGEYSLKHWIDLILKKNIVLPPYQRRFVWDEKKVKALIKAFKDNQFVPPVTIGAFTIDGKPQNLILDGQQRLTSILLAYLGLYPNRTKWEDMIDNYANDNDDEQDVDQPQKELKWKFKELTNIGKNREGIQNEIKKGYSDCYDPLTLDVTINDDFLNKIFLGFSYLVPVNTIDENAQLKYYSTVFRDINIQGVSLSPQESRESLYFLDKEKPDFFAPEFCKSIKVNGDPLDFVRYLALLSQYYYWKNETKIAAGYGNKKAIEVYYEKYIHSTVNDEDSSTFGKFSTIFPEKNYTLRLNELRKTLVQLDFPQSFQSIINLDIYFFGLIYEVVFENKRIDVSKKEELKDELNGYRADDAHKRAPAALKYLRPRIAASIEIYKRYVKE